MRSQPTLACPAPSPPTCEQILFCLLFLISSYTFAENVRRNTLRNECRQHIRDFDSSQIGDFGSGLELSNVDEWMRLMDSEDRCGCTTIEAGVNDDVRRWPPPQRHPGAKPYLVAAPCGRFRSG